MHIVKPYRRPINWGHPLADKLRFLLPVFGPSLTEYELVTGQGPTTINNGGPNLTTGTSRYGPEIRGDGWNTSNFIRFPLEGLTGYPHTLAALYNVRTGHSTAAHNSAVDITNNGAGTDNSLGTNATPNFHWAGRTGTNLSASFTDSGVSALDVPRLAVMVHRAADDHVLYVDGYEVATNATSIPFPSPAPTVVTLGMFDDSTPSNGLGNGDIQGVWVWDRDLSPAEVRALAADPFAMLRRPSTMMLWPSALAGGGDTTAPTLSSASGAPLLAASVSNVSFGATVESVEAFFSTGAPLLLNDELIVYISGDSILSSGAPLVSGSIDELLIEILEATFATGSAALTASANVFVRLSTVLATRAPRLAASVTVPLSAFISDTLMEKWNYWRERSLRRFTRSHQGRP